MTRRRITGIAAALSVLAGAIAVCGPSRDGDGAASRWETAPVARGSIAARVSATGTLSPLVEVQVGSQVSGRIQELYADFNAPVTKGQVIARIDPRLFETEVARARANVVAAEAAVARAEADLLDARLRNERAAGLYERGMGSRADAETTHAARQAAQAALASAQASLAQARAALEQAETNLGYTTIYSPETVQNVVTYDAVVSVENPELELRPGMTAEVVFLVEQREDVLLVPSAALRFVPPPETLAAVAPPPSEPDEDGPTRVVWALG